MDWHDSAPQAPDLSQAFDGPSEGVIVIPWQQLSADALDGIIEEFVSREGTDYGDYEYSFDDKKDQIRAQIRNGSVLVVFDPVGETCQLVLKDQLPPGLI